MGRWLSAILRRLALSQIHVDGNATELADITAAMVWTLEAVLASIQHGVIEAITSDRHEQF
jgi:hypothetical protein